MVYRRQARDVQNNLRLPVDHSLGATNHVLWQKEVYLCESVDTHPLCQYICTLVHSICTVSMCYAHRQV